MAFYAPMAVIALFVRVKWKHIDHVFTSLDGEAAVTENKGGTER